MRARFDGHVEGTVPIPKRDGGVAGSCQGEAVGERWVVVVVVAMVA